MVRLSLWWHRTWRGCEAAGCPDLCRRYERAGLAGHAIAEANRERITGRSRGGVGAPLPGPVGASPRSAGRPHRNDPGRAA